LSGAPFPTGGKGVVDPSFKLGPLDTDQNVLIDHDPFRGQNSGLHLG